MMCHFLFTYMCTISFLFQRVKITRAQVGQAQIPEAEMEITAQCSIHPALLTAHILTQWDA